MPYVPLDRRFETLPPPDSEGGSGYIHYDLGIGWPELLEKPLVVILGPGGIGKTTEMREQARRLRAEGRAAVFVALDQLIDQPFDQALDDENAAAFRRWDPARDDAVFLLDAVNEAKLTKAQAFARVLRAFTTAVRHGAGRVRVLLSCRPSDWLHLADPDTVHDALRGLFQETVAVSASGDGAGTNGPASTPGSRAPAFGVPPAVTVTVMRLTPLDADQIRRLAEHHRVNNVDAFLDALKRTGRLFLAGRPRDLEWLAESWNREGRLGSRWDMLDQNVRAKLGERNDAYGNESLSPERARYGAERLAGATFLSRQPLIRIPDPPLAVAVERPALDPAAVLPDWSAHDIAALLRRPLFEEAPGGRVRFHHATTQAFLAARWLLRQLEAGCLVSRVVDLLSHEVYGQRYLIPSVREVAGWIVCRNAEVRHALIGVAPELTLLWGDATQVPVEDRVAALGHFAKLYQGAPWVPWTTEDDDLARLSDPALGPTVRRLLEEAEGSPAVRHFLLDVMRVGEMPEAAETALTLALDPAQDLRIRSAAVCAVGGAGDADLHGRLRAHALGDADLPNRLLATVGAVLFPKALSVEDLGALLAQFAPQAINTVGGPPDVVIWGWVDACPPTDRIDLLERMTDLATRAPYRVGRRTSALFPVSERYGWLVPAILRLAVLEVRRTAGSDTPPAPALITALRLLYEVQRAGAVNLYDLDDLRSAVAANAAIRRALFATVLMAEAEDPVVGFGGIEGRFYRSQEGDADWLLTRSTQVETADHRARLLLGSCLIARRGSLSDGLEDRLRSAIDAGGLSPAEAERFRQWIAPPPAAPVPDLDHEATDREKAAAEAAQWAEARRQLTAKLPEIRSGEACRELHYLTQQMRGLPGGVAMRWGQGNIHSLEPRFGVELTGAAAEGFRRMWRRWCPPLRSERGDPSSVEAGVIVGLTGLAALDAEGADFTTLSPEETRIAVHYALREMNGPPEWFNALIAAKPAVVKDVLLREIGAVLKKEHDDLAVLHSLRDIANLEPAARLVAAEVLAMLEPAECPPAHGLAEALAIAGRVDGAATERLAALSAQRVAALWHRERETAWPWLQAWFRSDVDAAWRFVEAALTTAPEEARTVLVRLLQIWDGELTDVEAGGGRYLGHLPLLAKVVPTVFRHLPPRDDPQHDGVYEVTDEDRAATMRGRLARALEQIDGPDAHAVLTGLTAHPELGEVQQFFHDAVRRHGEKAAEFHAWTPDQLVAFAAAHERDPANAEQLYRVTLDRLAVIREDIEGGDFGDRGIFPQDTPEITLQRYFAGRLKRESRGRYTVTREEEVADHKEPDIRIRHTTAGVVSIEIKPLDDGRYTLLQLMSTLEDQLVGQYMRTVGSHHGILLLCLLKKRTWRLTDPPEVIDFPELVHRLNAFAAFLMAQRPDIKGLTVVGIDATDWKKDAAKPPKAKPVALA